MVLRFTLRERRDETAIGSASSITTRTMAAIDSAAMVAQRSPIPEVPHDRTSSPQSDHLQADQRGPRPEAPRPEAGSGLRHRPAASRASLAPTSDVAGSAAGGTSPNRRDRRAVA